MSFSPLCRRLCKRRAKAWQAKEEVGTKASESHSSNLAFMSIDIMATLHFLMKPRIICTNMISELGIIDQLNDDWDTTDKPDLDLSALDIHLHCEYAAKECQAIVDILDAFIEKGSGVLPMVVEMCIRQENALNEAKKVLSVVQVLMLSETDTELGLKELERRSGRVVSKLGNVQCMVEELQVQGQQAHQEQQGQEVYHAQQQLK